MKVINLLILTVIVLSTFCCVKPQKKDSLPTVKTAPVFTKGQIDPEIKVIVDEYKALAKYYGIVFKNEVTIGFSDIKRDGVVGICTYGFDFREIDLDRRYWKYQTWTSKLILTYHELDHCYCDRRHDYGREKNYPDASFFGILTRYSGEGYMTDGCPLSLMHPIVMDDVCLNKHYSYYVKEMFDRCNPY